MDADKKQRIRAHMSEPFALAPVRMGLGIIAFILSALCFIFWIRNYDSVDGLYVNVPGAALMFLLPSSVTLWLPHTTRRDMYVFVVSGIAAAGMLWLSFTGNDAPGSLGQLMGFVISVVVAVGTIVNLVFALKPSKPLHSGAILPIE